MLYLVYLTLKTIRYGFCRAFCARRALSRVHWFTGVHPANQLRALASYLHTDVRMLLIILCNFARKHVFHDAETCPLKEYMLMLSPYTHFSWFKMWWDSQRKQSCQSNHKNKTHFSLYMPCQHTGVDVHSVNEKYLKCADIVSVLQGNRPVTLTGHEQNEAVHVSDKVNTGTQDRPNAVRLSCPL